MGSPIEQRRRELFRQAYQETRLASEEQKSSEKLINTALDKILRRAPEKKSTDFNVKLSSEFSDGLVPILNQLLKAEAPTMNILAFEKVFSDSGDSLGVTLRIGNEEEPGIDAVEETDALS